MFQVSLDYSTFYLLNAKIMRKKLFSPMMEVYMLNIW